MKFVTEPLLLVGGLALGLALLVVLLLVPGSFWGFKPGEVDLS